MEWYLRTLKIAAVTAIVFCLILWVVYKPSSPLDLLPQALLALVVVFAVSAVVHLTGRIFWACWDRPDRAARLRHRGLCAGCGYDLKGNISGICPECGRPIERTDASGDRSSSQRFTP